MGVVKRLIVGAACFGAGFIAGCLAWDSIEAWVEELDAQRW